MIRQSLGLFKPYLTQYNSHLKYLFRNTNRIHFLKNKYEFSYEKKNNKLRNNPVEKNTEQNKHYSEQQFLWKLNILVNTVGICGGFYFPIESLMFVLASNGMIQAYQSSNLITRFKQITSKKNKQNTEKFNESVIQIKSIMKKITINIAIIFSFSVLFGIGNINPSFLDYSLIGLNFWILYNIKFSNFSHGFYFALLTLLAFQFLYFEKNSNSKASVKSSQRI